VQFNLTLVQYGQWFRPG